MEALRRYPAEMNGEVAPDDLMYDTAPGDRDNAYLALGRAALDCIRLGLLAAQKEAPRRILDLPSGHGRVTRVLQAEYPDAEVTACDIDHGAVKFCAETLGAEPLYGREDPADVDAGTYDLIWVGSLLTHLDRATWTAFLDFFERALEPGGVLVATTNGRAIAAKLRGADADFWMPDADRRDAILRDYEGHGFGFAEYPTSPEERAVHSEPSSYGVSLSHPSWVSGFFARPDLQLLTFQENRWGAQDVIGLVKVEAVEEGRTPLRGITGTIRRPRPELYRR